jgi:hypothetical protein
VTNYFLPLLKLISYDERRKARNYLLKPAFQLKLPLYTLLLSFTFGSAALLVGYIYFEQLYAMMIENTTQGDYLRETVNQQTGNFIEASVTLMIGYVLLMVAVTTIYTHRIIGPTVAITRHIRALKNGLYSHRVNLRKHDALKDLAGELNELAETLETYENKWSSDN